MSSHAEKAAATILRAIEKRGVHGVHVEVDSEEVAYLDGEVATREQEALAVEAAIDAGAVSVVDGIHYPGQEKDAMHFHHNRAAVPHDGSLMRHGHGSDSGPS